MVQYDWNMKGRRREKSLRFEDSEVERGWSAQRSSNLKADLAGTANTKNDIKEEDLSYRITC